MRKSLRPTVIVFIGNVGSGKTTHISIAFNELNKSGYEVHRTYIKTFFAITMLLSKLHMFQKVTWRIAVALDLFVNSIYLPLITLLRTTFLPTMRKKRIVLVEEHLPGSLVDYVHAATILSLVPIVIPAIKLLTKLSRGNMWHGIVYTMAYKSLLPKRWEKRETPFETKTYLFTQDLVFKIITKHYNAILYVDTSKDLDVNRQRVADFILKTVH